MAIHTRNHGTVLITGASAGIGHELALEFGACAETLVLVARRLDRLERLRKELVGRYPGLKVVVLEADLSHEHEIERLLAKVSEQAGVVDVLVNNAGSGDSVLFDRSDWTRTRQVFEDQHIGCGSTYLGTRAGCGGARPRRGAQHRIRCGPHGSGKRGRMCREQAFRGRIQRSATRRPFGNGRNCDTSVSRSGGERIR